MRSYFEDLSAEVRRAPWLVGVAVVALLFAGSLSSTAMSGVREALRARMQIERSPSRTRTLKKEVRCLMLADAGASDSDDVDMQ